MGFHDSAGQNATTNGTSSKTSPSNKFAPNTLYLTFNAPQHRGLFITYQPPLCEPNPTFSGTLIHAVYQDSKWAVEKRMIKDLSTSKTLCLLYRIQTVKNPTDNLDMICNRIISVLEKVPVGRTAREAEIGPCYKKGNPALDNYDCVIWTGDALQALIKEGLIDLQGRDVDEVMDGARAMAGPANAKSMVGKDFGGLKVVM